MEELLPGRETAGSKEARRDQKRAAGEALHGAHRDKEEARVRKCMFYSRYCVLSVGISLR